MYIIHCKTISCLPLQNAMKLQIMVTKNKICQVAFYKTIFIAFLTYPCTLKYLFLNLFLDNQI